VMRFECGWNLGWTEPVDVDSGPVCSIGVDKARPPGRRCPVRIYASPKFRDLRLKPSADDDETQYRGRV
jgi:hypothetical protein